jgi:type I restriction enzyme S subunit
MEGNKKLPKGWIIKKIGDVVFFQKGKLPKSFSKEPKEGFLSYIDIKAFEDASVRRYAKNDNVVLTSEADVLIVWDGSRFGFSGMGVSGVLGSTLARLYSEIIDVKYLYYFLQSKYRFINSRPRGTGTPHVDPEVFWNLDFSLPPLNEQKRIVDKIEMLFSDLDKGEALLKQVQKQLGVYRQSVLKAAVTGELTRDWREQNEHRLESGEALLQRILESRRKNWKGRGSYQEPISVEKSYLIAPDNWVLLELMDISQRITDGTHQSPEFQKEGIPFVVIGDVKNGFVEWNKVSKWVSEETYEECTRRCRPEKGDILYTAVGSYGIALKVDEEKKFMFQRHIAHIKPISGVMNLDYLLIVLNSPITLSYAHKVARGVAQKTVTLGDLSHFHISIPSQEEQDIIVDFVNQALVQIDALEKWCATELARSGMLRQSILKAAFSGELVPQDPRDEPASELLARIQAERASAARDGNAPKTTGRRGRKATT